MNYRPYHRQDFPRLYAIEEVCFQAQFRFPPRHLRRLLESPGTITWIAEQDGQMAGFSIADCEWESGGLVAYIQTIEVLPERRAQGIGSELLRRIEDSALEIGAQSIWLHVEPQNSGAIRLYEAHGYSCEGRKDQYYPQGRAALIYRKVLAPAQRE